MSFTYLYFRSFVVLAATRKEKLDWMIAIMTASEDWKVKKSSFGKQDGEYVIAAPVWVPDSQVTECGICSESFSLLKRRHHCR